MSNKDVFESLMDACRLTQTKAAKVISEVTFRPLSARTVRSWLTDPSKPSYRPCPDWAIDALKEYQSRPLVFDDDPAAELSPSENVDSDLIDPAIAAGLPYTTEELMKAFEAAYSEKPAQKPMRRSKKTQQDYENIRYRCPECGIQVWGTDAVIVACVTCDQTMKKA